MYSSSGSLRCGLALMAWPAQRFEIAVFIGAAVSFRGDVVDRFRRAWPAVAQALLADVSITLKDADADDVPLTAVATLVAAQAALMLLPPFITMRHAVAGTVCGGAGAPSFTAGARDSCWHIVGSNKKATSRCQWLIKFNKMCHSSRGGPANKLFTQSMNRILKVRIDLILC